MLLEPMSFTPFPYIKEFASNMTISGSLCYAQNLYQFQTYCKEKLPETKEWIVANPFDKNYTNEILINKEQSKDIDALIIVFDVPLET